VLPWQGLAASLSWRQSGMAVGQDLVP